jgi:putative flippase GtrA
MHKVLSHPNAIERFLVTVLACLLGAGVALFAPPLFTEALDMVARWVAWGAVAALVVLTIDEIVYQERPRIARAVGRAAFKVARAAYKVANR